MWAALFGAVAIGSAGYIGVLRSFSRKSLSTSVEAVRYLTMTTLVSALACACALAFPLIFSSDVYAYAGYGDMALHGIDPYAHARIAARDPLLDAMQWQWGNPPPMSVYGPAFVWISKIFVTLFLPLGAAAPLWAFRVLACAALVACAPLAYTAFRSFPRSHRMLAAAGICLNPIAIWACAEGHNDALVLAVVLAGFALAARSRAFTGAATIALAALVKAPALAAAGAFSIYAWHDARRRTSVVCGTAAGALAVIAIAAPLEYGVRSHLAPAGHYIPQFSLQYALASIVPLQGAAALIFTLALIAAAVGLWRLFQGRRDGAIPIALAVWLAIPNPYPWYALWILPVAFLAASDASYAMWAVIAASLLIVFRYYGDATTDLSKALGIGIVAVEYGLPLIILMGGRMYRARRDRRGIRTPVPGFATTRNL